MTLKLYEICYKSIGTFIDLSIKAFSSKSHCQDCKNNHICLILRKRMNVGELRRGIILEKWRKKNGKRDVGEIERDDQKGICAVTVKLSNNQGFRLRILICM
jgi:hypothetical protein